MLRILFGLVLCIFVASCSSLRGKVDGKSVILRNDTVVVTYGGSLSQPN